MAKGTIAKGVVEKKISEAFGEDFIGVSDKRIYVWANDGAEKVQIAISMTCPKVGLDVATIPQVAVGMDFEAAAQIQQTTAEITSDEKETIADLMRKLGL